MTAKIENGSSDGKKELNFGPRGYIGTDATSSRVTDNFVKIKNDRHLENGTFVKVVTFPQGHTATYICLKLHSKRPTNLSKFKIGDIV